MYSNLAEDDLGDSLALSRDGSTFIAGGDAGGSGQAGMAVVYNVCLLDESSTNLSTSPTTRAPSATAPSTTNPVVGALAISAVAL